MNVLLGNKYNTYTWVFSASSKTLAIYGIVGFSPEVVNLVSVYDVAIGAKFSLMGVTSSYSYISGLPVYVYTFGYIPNGASDNDTLIIFMNIPDTVGAYNVLQSIANGSPVSSGFTYTFPFQLA